MKKGAESACFVTLMLVIHSRYWSPCRMPVGRSVELVAASSRLWSSERERRTVYWLLRVTSFDGDVVPYRVLIALMTWAVTFPPAAVSG